MHQFFLVKMSAFPHLLLYDRHAAGQFSSLFRFKFRTRILTDLHIVRNRMRPVASAGMAILQKLFGSNQQTAFEVLTDPVKLERMRRHDHYKTIRIDFIFDIVQTDFKRTLESQHH